MSDISRRRFLQVSAGSLAGVVLVRCGGSGKGGPGDGGLDAGAAADAGVDAGAGASVPWGGWQEMQTAVQTSPDHLPAAAARAVATGDANTIFQFVRDQFVAYPADSSDVVETQMRWGTRGTLRGGAGTPREEVELLNQLLTQAGFQVQVMSASVVDDSSGSLASQVYLQQVTRSFAPDVDDATVEGWLAQLTAAGGTLGDYTQVDPNGTQAQAIVNAITPLLPAGVGTNVGGNPLALGTEYYGQLETIPFVSVMIDGVATNANVLFPSANLGDPLPPSGGFAPTMADPPDPAPTVTVSVSMVTVLNPTTPVSLVTASFGADQLAGRQMWIQFPPAAADLGSALALTVEQIMAFRPLLYLGGRDVDLTADPSLASVGPFITLHGDVLTDDNGTITINNQPLYTSSQIVAGAAATVASVALAIKAGAFTNIVLSVSALDASGNAVLGLAASDFTVLEDGAPVSLLLTGAPSQTLRVMIVLDYDGPLSTGDDPIQLAQALTSAILAAYPNAAVQIPFSDTLYTDPTAMAAAYTTLGTDSDNTWAELGDAASRNPAVVVMVSDFLAQNFATETLGSSSNPTVILAEISAGPPIIAVTTQASGDATIDPEISTLVNLTGGQLLEGVGTTATIAAVMAYLKTYAAKGAYTLEYSAPSSGPSTRNVTVAVNSTMAAETYNVPAASAALPPPAIAGLYLTVTVGNNTVTRVMGGYGGDVPITPGTPIDPSLLQEVTDTLFGTTMLSFEGTGPTPSLQLDDLLAQKLSLQPAVEAVAADDGNAIVAAWPALRAYVPNELLSMKAPLPPPTSSSVVTYEQGLRVIAQSQRPRFALNTNEIRVDILPVTQWGSLGVSPQASFMDALNRTALLAVMEQAVCQTSTASALAGVSLTMLNSGSEISGSDLPSTYDANTQAIAARVLNEYPNCYVLVPSALPFSGFWAVDSQSGALIGVLPDGTGGGASSSTCMALAASDNGIGALGSLGGLAGAGAGSAFAVGLAVIVADVYLITAAIFDGATADSPAAGLAAAAGCGAATAGLNYGPFAGSALGKLLNGTNATTVIASAAIKSCSLGSQIGC